MFVAIVYESLFGNTREIAEAIESHLDARGAAVIVRARHLCMECRGVRQSGSEMVTTATRGVFRNDAQARAEFFRLAGM